VATKKTAAVAAPPKRPPAKAAFVAACWIDATVDDT
jgi:hypothetical protein